MSRYILVALAAALLSATAAGAGGWPPSDAALKAARPGATILQRLDADLDGDGKPEAVLALGYEDTPDRDAFNTIEVLWKHREQGGPRSDEDDAEPNNQFNLPTSPLGAPQLSVKNGVLRVDYLAGGTTATQSTYRFRYDKQADDMRLIGLDAERYSRTGAHGSLRLSWNVVTGTRIVQRGSLGKDGALRFGPEQKTVDTGRTWVYMADTPDPEELLDALVD